MTNCCNKYNYAGSLGRGSYGDVVLASVQGTDKQYAVKCLSLDALSKRTLVEIQNHKKLVHPHIIRFKEVFDDEHGLYIAMEYAELGDLDSHVQQQPQARLSESHARWYFQQLIIAVDFCHKMNVGHRDLKLCNVLLAPNPANPRLHLLKLADFGLATNHVDTLAKSHVGTPCYMAPEVIAAAKGPCSAVAAAAAAAQPASDTAVVSDTTNFKDSNSCGSYNPKRADIWSCGVMLYKMLTGRNAFFPEEGRLQGSHGDVPEGDAWLARYQAVLKGCPLMPEGVSISKECQDLLQQLLNPNPKARIAMPGIVDHPWFRQKITVEVLGMNELYLKGGTTTAEGKEAQQSDERVAAVVARALARAVRKRRKAFFSATGAAAAGMVGSGAEQQHGWHAMRV